MSYRLLSRWTLALAFLSSLIVSPTRGAVLEGPWWKGNLHTHTLWSDGDDFPDMVTAWYKEHGYHFLVLSDHNAIQQGERWIDVLKSKAGPAGLDRYRAAFGSDWVEQRAEGDKLLVRLKTLDDMRPRFEEPGRFLMITGEEITDNFDKLPIHMNAYHLREFIKPQGGTSVVDVLQRNVDAVLEQRRRTGQAMVPHVNHPNFGYAITAEQLMQIRGERLFEVYNGHPSVHNEGDETRTGLEKVWDIALAFRLTELKLGPLYGLAVDDAHNYRTFDLQNSNPGRGWVVVQASRLEPTEVVEALEAGAFYSSTGVVLNRIESDSRHLAISIRPEEGVTYRTLFIGTRQGFDPTSRPVEGAGATVTRRYSEGVGEILAEVPGLEPSYTFDGDELYVRANVLSSKAKPNPYRAGEQEVAWVQPVIR